MERRFRLFLILVISFAAAALAALSVLTYTHLHDSASRLEREDRAAFTALAERLADPENITGVRIQVKSTMGDYARYSSFDKSLLSGLTFASHDSPMDTDQSLSLPDDTTITVSLYKTPDSRILRRILSFLDGTFGTDFLTETEKVVLSMDGDLYRITYREKSFTAKCPAMTEWIRTMQEQN